MTWLSLLLTPLKLASGVAVAAAAAADAGARGTASAAEKAPDGSRRAPFSINRAGAPWAGVCPGTRVCLGTSRATPLTPV